MQAQAFVDLPIRVSRPPPSPPPLPTPPSPLLSCARSTFKRKAPRAIREIKKFAQKMMGTADVRVDASLNKKVWQQGVRNVPYRIRVKLARRRSSDEDAEEKMFTLVTYVPEVDFKGKVTTAAPIEDDEE
jgi:large subunit ribosomal protein L31e